jgi:hypothetical protein
VCGGRRLQEFPDKEYQVPDKEYQVPRQGISGSPTRNIRFPTGGYILSNSKIIVLYVQLMFTHENVEFFGSEMVQNLLSVTVHLPALQNKVITKHNSSQYIPLP